MRLITILIITFICEFVIAQENPNKAILNKYKNIKIDFFTSSNSVYTDNYLYKAFRSKINGDQEAYISYLEKSFKKAKQDSIKKQIGSILYYVYLDKRQRDKAVELNRSSNELNFNIYSDIVAKKSDYPSSKLETLDNQTEVDFDQFYFDAVVNKNDTVKVFFDTGAPGISVNQDLVEKYNWETDTTYHGYSYVPAMDMTFKKFPVMLPNLKIGSFEFKNLSAHYNMNPKEQEVSEEKESSVGIENYDIMIGINVFEELLDGVKFDFKEGKLKLIKNLPEKQVKPNFMMVDAKPAIEFTLSDNRYTAFLDTGSPRHVLPDKLITEDNSYFKEKSNYGDYEYDIFHVKYDKVLNQKDIWLDSADYGGFNVSDTFKIDALFGSFLGRTLTFDFKNRRAEIYKD